MEGKNKKTKVFKWATVLLLAAMVLFTGCPNAAGGNSGGNITPPAPAGSYNAVTGKGVVGGVEFTMKKIDVVTDGNLGDDSQHNNKLHKVSLTAYRIGETEVTQELWEKVMSNNPSDFSSRPESGEVQEKRPVENVSWYQCIVFCNELTKKVPELGESQCVYTVDGHTYGTTDATAKKEPAMDMNKKGFRLPTEAEWEWAAMGGKDYKWSGTNVESELKDYAWYGGVETHEVKKKTANGYGLYDMSGNVWEWCWDRYGTLPNPLPEDYSGADSGSSRVIRGGGWLNDANGAARAFRVNRDPGYCDFHLGLRVVSRP